MVAADAQQGFEFAVDSDVDVLSGFRAGKVQPFYGGSPFATGSDGSGLCSLEPLRDLNRVVDRQRDHSAVSGEFQVQSPSLRRL